MADVLLAEEKYSTCISHELRTPHLPVKGCSRKVKETFRQMKPSSGNEKTASVLKVVNRFTEQVSSAIIRKEDLFLNIKDAIVCIPECDLEIIIAEIFDNAFRCSNPGIPVVVTSETDENSCTISISDYGKGMTPEQLSYISSFLDYKKFGMQRPVPGTGLRIIRQVASMYSVKLSIESEMGLFTELRLKFPLSMKQKPELIENNKNLF